MLGEFYKRFSPYRRLNADGYALVPRFLNRIQATELAAVVEGCYAALASASTITDPLLSEHFLKWKGVWLQTLPDFLGDQPLARHFQSTIAIIERRTQRLFGPRWKLSGRHSFFRRVDQTAALLPWHIDADAAGTFAAPSINVWLPLDAVGDRLPGVELVPGSQRVMATLPLLPAQDAYREETFASELGPAVAPRLTLGGALVFDRYTLHRSQRTAGAFMRTACELRFVDD